MAQRKPQRFNVELGALVGDWRILSYGPDNRHGARRMLCRCERCGTERLVVRADLASGRSRGDGCYRRQLMLQSRHLHAHAPRGAKSATWRAWRDMKRRYGEGRVCLQWWHSFEAFLQDVGHKPTPNHRLQVQRGKPLLPSTVSWTLKRETTIPKNINRAKRREQDVEARQVTS